MKIVKGISLFFLYPVMMLVIGFYAGVELTHYFYPGDRAAGIREGSQESGMSGSQAAVPYSGADVPGTEGQEREVEGFGMSGLSGQESGAMSQTDAVDPNRSEGEGADAVVPGDVPEEGTAVEAASSPERLYVDTEYVLEETDIDDQTVVETAGKLPEKYIGMNREQFLAAMENYAAAPPLTEMERGFVGLEVLSFSRERVVIRMDYSYVKPSTSYYLAVYDNQVLVYLDDLETVYIETDIRLDSLPEDVQQEIIQMKWIENEEALFNFLESYSS